MAKRQVKSVRKQPAKPAREPDSDPVDADFVKALLGLCYRHNSDGNAGKEEYRALNERDKREVRAVAAGFLCINQLLHQELKRVAIENMKSPTLGNPSIFHALDVVNSLILGTDHPAWRHVANVHKVLKGRARRPPSFEIRRRWSYVAQMVLAVEEALERETGRRSRRKAIARVSEACSKMDAAPWAQGARPEQYSAQKIKDFMDRGEILAPEGDVVAYLLAQAEKVKDGLPLADRVIETGFWWLKFFSGAPVPELADLPPRVEQ